MVDKKFCMSSFMAFRYIEKEDVEEAVSLIKVATQQAATDPVTGVIDMDLLQTGITSSSRARMSQIVDIIKTILRDYQENARKGVKYNSLGDEVRKRVNELGQQTFNFSDFDYRDALKKLTKCVGLDSFEQLPLVFKKTEQQMSNINMYKEKLEVQNDKLQYEKEVINEQIDLLSGKKREGIAETSKIIQEKKKNIEIINQCAENFKKEIAIRMKLIEALYPKTKEFRYIDYYLSTMS